MLHQGIKHAAGEYPAHTAAFEHQTRVIAKSFHINS
jgi:hypothetical protein